MQKESELILVGKQVIYDEITGLNDLYNAINADFCMIIKKIMSNKGRLILSGMGKSGYVARKISSTLSSTGAPSFFIHPAEAGHGDLGMITKEDIVILLSNSGDTNELNTIIDYCQRFGIFIIGVTRKNNSILSKISNLPIILPNTKEAFDLDAPSTSVIMMIAFWDAIAIALQKIRNFSKADFSILHPGGKIGTKLLKVSKLMHTNEAMPTVSINSSGMDVIIEMTKKRFGCTGVLNSESELIGIITDGDIRRYINIDFKTVTASDIMRTKPFTIKKDSFASQALLAMNKNNITQIFVLRKKKPVGIMHMHDLVRAGIV